MFYITTPIYYVNDEPHLGHAYTTILADVLARYHRLRGEAVFFLTGVDEHGEKVTNAFKRRGIDNPSLEELQAYVDEMAARFQKVWAALHIQYDDFIRTTQPRHVKVVQAALQQLWEAGQIYPGDYEGWYCVHDERFWTEKDLLTDAEGRPACPLCGRAVERIVEPNYFFRMGAYQDWLVDYITAHSDFVLPGFRRNEVLGFLRKPLGDLCITRPKARLTWGIPLPFDPDYVTYVWFDALLNYLTGAGYLQDGAKFAEQWPNTVHLMAKDILTTHSVYWPTMLQALGLPQPRHIFAHGYWVIGGKKMGKSLGNAVRPLDLVDIYGVDGFRYFLMRDMAQGQDADFDAQRVGARYTADLANTLGNLLQRVTSMTGLYFNGVLPTVGEVTQAEIDLRELVEALPEQVFADIEDFAISGAITRVMDVLVAVNTYLERTAPWREAKAGDTARVAVILWTAGEALRIAALLLSPVMPERMAEVFRRLGWTPPERLSDGLAWGLWQPGSQVSTGDPLFPHIEVEAIE